MILLCEIFCKKYFISESDIFFFYKRLISDMGIHPKNGSHIFIISLGKYADVMWCDLKKNIWELKVGASRNSILLINNELTQQDNSK